MHLDAVDYAILRELYRWDVTNFPRGSLRVPLRELSARLRVQRNTVQARLASMRRAGILEGIVFESCTAAARSPLRADQGRVAP